MEEDTENEVQKRKQFFFLNHRVAQNKNQKLERKREKQTLSEPT